MVFSQYLYIIRCYLSFSLNFKQKHPCGRMPCVAQFNCMFVQFLRMHKI
jgi:hypothetical protein